MITDALPQTLDETFSALADLAHRRVSTLPPKLVAAHVVSVTAGADWSVRAAALEAIVRRLRFAERDELVIKTRPRHRVLGGYTTGRKGERVARPYESWVGSIAPLRARCSCADFLRSSLGVCKHVLAVLTDLFVHERRVRAALREGDTGGDGFAVTWSPEIALEGPLDRLVSLRRALTPGKAPAGWVPARAEATNAADVLWARALPGATQRPQTPRLAPDRTALHDPERRLAFLRALTRNAGALDPAARALAAEELARTEARTAAAGVAPLALAHLRSLRRKLYPYQEEGVRRFLEAGRLLLADDMGLGKTTQAIAACHALYRARKVKRGVLIVPAALKSQWLREWEETTDVPAASVDGSPAERAATYRALERGFLLIGYEQLLKDFAHVAELAPDLVVLDEAQRIKNFATKSATYVKALTPRWRLVLTGTPMENRLGELASLLDWIDDLALAPKWRLDPWYLTQARAGDAASGGARHLDTLRTRLAPCTIRRRREEVLRDLPTRTDTRVPVSMTEQQRLEHDDLNQPIAQLVAIAKKRPLRPPEFLRLMTLLASQRMISNGLGQVRFEEMWPAYSGARPDAALIEGLFAPKLVELRRLVEELVLGQKRKVVIFSQWRRMLRLAEWSLRDILGDAGVRAVFFTGAESQKQRTRSIVDFHDEPDVRVMLLSDAGGVGLNLQRAASACINLELPWNPAVLEQRIGRIYRIGQKRPIDVYNLINEYGIESRIAHLVATKQAIFRGLFDGDSDEVRFEGRGSFFADVERLVAEAPIASDPPAAAAEDAEDDTAFADTPDVALPRAPAAQPADLAALFATLRVRTTADGSVSIEAPREAAVALTAVFAGMAQIMAAAARGE